VTIRSSAPIDFQKLPPFDDLEALAVEASPQSALLTTWQNLLPSELASRELLSPWISDPFYRMTWERLRNMPTRTIHDDRLDAFG